MLEPQARATAPGHSPRPEPEARAPGQSPRTEPHVRVTGPQAGPQDRPLDRAQARDLGQSRTVGIALGQGPRIGLQARVPGQSPRPGPRTGPSLLCRALSHCLWFRAMQHFRALIQTQPIVYLFRENFLGKVPVHPIVSITGAKPQSMPSSLCRAPGSILRQ